MRVPPVSPSSGRHQTRTDQPQKPPENPARSHRFDVATYWRACSRFRLHATLQFANARGQPLTRFGVRYLLRRYVAAAAKVVPSLRDKSIHPHSLRHSTAIALLKSGVDFATISQWLGLFDLHPSVTVLPLTSLLHDAPLLRITVRPSAANGLRAESQVMVDKPSSILRERLGPVFGRVDDETMLAVNRALAVFIGLA